MTTAVPLRFRYAARSDAGPVREDNQDAAYADARLLVVADGMGGHPSGDVAASLMTQAFAHLTLHPSPWDVVDNLRAATLAGEDAIAAHVAANPHLDGMGTTLTALLLKGNRLGLLHSGDTRAYLHRNGRLYQLSRDDTLVQSLIEGGTLARDEARRHPMRNVITRALVGRDTRFSLASWMVTEGDRLLLCSDGLYAVVSDETLAEILGRHDPEQCAVRLVTLALQSGTHDNVTCVVADVVSDESATSPVVAGALAKSSVRSWRGIGLGSAVASRTLASTT
jgi:serine/threonine protein phosphatase PrpC